MLRVYVDFDDVLSQTARGFVELLEATFGKRVELEEIVSFDLTKSFDLSREEFDRFMRTAHLPEHLIGFEPMAGAVEVLAEWHGRGYEIEVLTGRPPASGAVSREWLERHRVPYSELYFVDKYPRFDETAWNGHGPVLKLDDLPDLEHDLVVEDSLKTAAFLAERTTARILMIDKPWNRNVTNVPDETLARIERVDDWVEVSRRVAE